MELTAVSFASISPTKPHLKHSQSGKNNSLIMLIPQIPTPTLLSWLETSVTWIELSPRMKRARGVPQMAICSIWRPVLWMAQTWQQPLKSALKSKQNRVKLMAPSACQPPWLVPVVQSRLVRVTTSAALRSSMRKKPAKKAAADRHREEDWYLKVFYLNMV